MRRCDLLPEDCVADHLCPKLNARPRPNKRGWVADCPACGGKNKLSISTGSLQRVVWECHRGCTAITVKRAMLAAKVLPACIPWEPPGRDVPAPEPERTDQERLAEIEQIILSDSGNPQRIRLLIGMTLWDCGRAEAAGKLGISRATAYRAVSPVRQTPRKPAA